MTHPAKNRYSNFHEIIKVNVLYFLICLHIFLTLIRAYYKAVENTEWHHDQTI